MFIYGCYLITALFGDTLWAYNIPILNFELRIIPFVLATTGNVVSILNNLIIISRGGIGKNGSSAAVS